MAMTNAIGTSAREGGAPSRCEPVGGLLRSAGPWARACLEREWAELLGEELAAALGQLLGEERAP